MCWIVGYVGDKDAAPLLIEALKRPEYRGYDSSGLAVLDITRATASRSSSAPAAPQNDAGDSGRRRCRILLALREVHPAAREPGRIDSGSPGAIYAIRRELFEPVPDDTILDDVLIALRIARRGYRVVLETQCQVA